MALRVIGVSPEQMLIETQDSTSWLAAYYYSTQFSAHCDEVKPCGLHGILTKKQTFSFKKMH